MIRREDEPILFGEALLTYLRVIAFDDYQRKTFRIGNKIDEKQEETRNEIWQCHTYLRNGVANAPVFPRDVRTHALRERTLRESRYSERGGYSITPLH